MHKTMCALVALVAISQLALPVEQASASLVFTGGSAHYEDGQMERIARKRGVRARHPVVLTNPQTGKAVPIGTQATLCGTHLDTKKRRCLAVVVADVCDPTVRPRVYRGKKIRASDCQVLAWDKVVAELSKHDKAWMFGSTDGPNRWYTVSVSVP